MKFRFSWFGVALILIGAALLLHRLGVVSLGWHVVAWGVVTLIGVVKLFNGFSLKQRGSAFWGTAFFLIGLYNVVAELGVFEFQEYLVAPALVLTLGTAFLAVFLVMPRDWHNLVPSLFFLGLGTLMVLAEMGFLFRWQVEDLVGTYWPVGLILFGAALLLSRRSIQSNGIETPTH
jgi:hypothetical protein